MMPDNSGALRGLVILLICTANVASAATIRGLVYDDANGDGKPSHGEPGIAGAVVAFGTDHFVVTDASGRYEIAVADSARGIVWARVPEGFRPGPVWATWDGKTEPDLALHRLAQPVTGPVTFVVAADTHLQSAQAYFGGADLAQVVRDATATDPAFFTILGDITQGNQDAEFDLVDRALAGLDVPWVPVPGNHDWYDDGAAWFRRFGPDNYSFDIGGVHFVVWNMTMDAYMLSSFLGGELARVPETMPIVALTHAPPSEQAIGVLRHLGVDYVLTGHAHSNRVVDHDGVIELNTEPLLMGALDFTPAGYRVITIDAGKLASSHRTVVDSAQVTIADACIRDGQLVVSAELPSGATAVTAQIDCATPFELRWAGGWSWRGRVALDPATPGIDHAITVTATSATGARVEVAGTITPCDAEPAPRAGSDWPQLGGDAAHTGARASEIAPPLVTRWTATAGGHVLHAPPAIAGGAVYVATTDLADGDAGGVTAFELATGAQKWRTRTERPLRGGVAIVGDLVIAAQIDGVVLALDAATGAVRWRFELSTELPAEAGALFASPTTDAGDVLVGHQRMIAALTRTGAPIWTREPVPDGNDSQSAAAVAVSEDVVVGTFNRALGGVIAWDRSSGNELWRQWSDETVAINASPVIAGDSVFVVSGADEVMSLSLANGDVQWRAQLDPAGFDWGNATVGTPAIASGVLVVPTLYRDIVALDAASGTELWRFAAVPGPLRTTHYRGRREAGYEASPVITGDVVWTADTSGKLTALDLHTGKPLWHRMLGTPVLAGLAASGDWLVIAGYDGTLRALAPGVPHTADAPATCSDTPPAAGAGCCDAGARPTPLVLLVLLVGAMLLKPRRPPQLR
jgi:outer membrane protein assembly factor BamB/predicted phosphodiesterase